MESIGGASCSCSGLRSSDDAGAGTAGQERVEERAGKRRQGEGQKQSGRLGEGQKQSGRCGRLGVWETSLRPQEKDKNVFWFFDLQGARMSPELPNLPHLPDCF